MHDVVPSAVRKAVSAATIIFATTSIIRFFFITLHFSLFTIHFSLEKRPLSGLFLGFVASGAAATFVVIVRIRVIRGIRVRPLPLTTGIRGSVAALTA